MNSDSPKVSIICALSENHTIGKDNKLLWDIPEDMKRFRNTTKGHAVIMGRKTHESIGRPLPKRTNIIITRNPEYQSEGCIIVSSLQEAIEEARKHEQEEIFIIGGGEIYRQALPLTDKLYLTIVKRDFDGDVFFPEYENLFRKETFRQESSDENHTYTFIDLER